MHPTCRLRGNLSLPLTPNLRPTVLRGSLMDYKSFTFVRPFSGLAFLEQILADRRPLTTFVDQRQMESVGTGYSERDPHG